MPARVLTPRLGSPPRVRGKVHAALDNLAQPGITPARAGKRGNAAVRRADSRDHPRACGEKHQWKASFPVCQGSPPRVRGKAAIRNLPIWHSRITPARAGKSANTGCAGGGAEDHPRACGEKNRPDRRRRSQRGSPPHARGKVAGLMYLSQQLGITPACAGKSATPNDASKLVRDHPRMRGEKSGMRYQPGFGWGSPPHARGKVLRQIHERKLRGITPACAGKRMLRATMTYEKGDHPRMRGEKPACLFKRQPGQGSPPHARGKAVIFPVANIRLGITPACAGKRPSPTAYRVQSGDHPRMRGEKKSKIKRSLLATGSPPHARGKAAVIGCHVTHLGITPACAGKSLYGKYVIQNMKDHPRVCEEKLCGNVKGCIIVGSPPRVRGKAVYRRCAFVLIGITPACAGKR